VVGGLGITLINNADRIKIACLAQLVNVIAPIVTIPGGPCFRQTIYWPFHDISRYGRGTAIIPILNCEKRETCHGDAPLIAAAVVHNEHEKMVTVFALNTDKDNKTELSIDTRSFGKLRLAGQMVLCGEDLSEVNSADKPEAVHPVNITINETVSDSIHSVVLEKASWNVIRFKME
jgi:alpha-N-arabinofuranosidase